MSAQTLVQSWLQGRAQITPEGQLQLRAKPSWPLAERIRRAYHWIANNAIHCPFADMDFGTTIPLGTSEQRVELARDEGYASFILLPLLNLIACRRVVIVGAPGRGKTTVATLMGLLAGDPLEDVRNSIQHGHPQLTLADLLGSPLPSELIQAKQAKDVRVSWRGWITRRVKIIDEYNRIPTKTQSALLSLMAEGYAESFEQIIQTGHSAWYLTANDDLGGGTFPVIEALKDRIDLVIRCMPFHSRYLEELAHRVELGTSPEELMPQDLVFTPEELDQASENVRAVKVPVGVQDIMGFLLGQLDFCQRASSKLEYRNKDTLHLSGRRLAHVCNEDCPLDKHENLCTQTENGVSARAFQTLLHFSKALAYFRGNSEVEIDDVRQLLPWVLHDKLHVNAQSGFFQKSENQFYLHDRVSWIRQLFDRAVAQHAAYLPMREPILKLKRELEQGVEGLTSTQIRQRQQNVQKQMEDVLQQNELTGAVHEDLVLLKSIYVAYQNQLRRREQKY